jgi:hypothetical protein
MYILVHIYIRSRKPINGRGKPLRWPRDTLYPQKLALASPISGGRSVGIVRLWTKSHGVKLIYAHIASIRQHTFPIITSLISLLQQYTYKPRSFTSYNILKLFVS